MNGLHLQTGSMNQTNQVIGMEHLTVTIGHGRKIQTDLCETERGWFVFLTVP